MTDRGSVTTTVPAPLPAPGASDPVIRLRDVAVSRGGREVWSHGTFDVPRGAVVGVIGPNGSGKSTLLQLLLGMVEPSRGSVEVLGEEPRRGDRRIGYVPQDQEALRGDAVRCRDLVALGLVGDRWGLRRGGSDVSGAVDGALRAVGAESFADRRVSEISGGQRQRIAIAQALVRSPEVLLLDEPLGGLDVRNQQEVAALLGAVSTGAVDDDHGDGSGVPVGSITTLVVTHEINPLLGVLTGAVYLLDGHPHYAPIGDVVDEGLLSHLYGTSVRVVRTPQGDFFTRSG